ncbi:MAG: BACON domain-containing carbohydrate-binding protein [Bacteroidales bacterium]|nr:BACON domain-containing carbohydrate-binding protein [Bacteroidales bacterium]
MTGNNDAATLGLSATDWSVIGYKGSSQNMPGLNKDGSIRLYGNASGGNYITVSSLSGATISSISITYTGATYNNGVVSVNGNTVTGSNGTYNINSSSFTLTNGNTSTTQVRVSSIVITYSSGSSGPVQLDAPELSATPSNNTVTLEWDAISNASSYTIQYADNDQFSGAATITDATSPEEITGLTNGTTYYFKAMTVGDETNYLSSDYGDAVSATPANVSRITITQDNLTNFTNTYTWYEWSSGDVSGQAYAYKNAGMQFNSSKEGYWIYNTSAIPGTITSVKMVKASGTDRSWTLKAGTSVISNTNDGTQIGEAQTVGTIGATWTVTDSNNYNYFLLYVSGGSTVISSIEITYIPSTNPIITATEPAELAYDATEGEFNYSITNPTSATLSAASNSGWITNVVVDGTNSKVTFNTSANPNTTQRTGTITLSYTGAEDKVITITQAAAPTTYSTIPALFDDASSIETEVRVTFGDWVVSGVSTNGKDVFVTDNSGNGFVIFDNNGGLDNTYAVGDILSGTAVTCNLIKYNGFAEITNLDATDLTITPGGTVTAANIALADLAGVNTGALVSYSNLTCSVNNNKYYLSDGTTTLQVYNSLFAFEALTDGNIYNITGIYQQYNNNKEILPRSNADIVEVTEQIDPTIPVADASIVFGSTFTVDDRDIKGGEITVTSGNPSIATVDGLVITPVAVGSVVITVSTAESALYYAGNATFTLTVTAPEGQTTKPIGTGVEIFKETFEACTGTNESFGISNSGDGNGTFNADDEHVWVCNDNKEYGANGAAKFGSSKVKGIATTPSISVTTGIIYNLTFKAAPWSQEVTTMTVSVTGGTISGVATDDAMTNGQWNDFSASITATSDVLTITFETDHNRFFLDEVIITAPSSVENPTVKTAASGYASYCCEYPIDLDELDSSVKAYAVSANSSTSATFTQLTGTIKGGVPFILKGDASTVYELTLADESTTVPSSNMLRGTLAPTYVTTEEGAYTNLGLSGGEFKRINPGTIKKNKAYLQVPTSSLSESVKSISITFEDATGIDHTEVMPIVDNEAWFDLSGRRVTHPTKGLYIHGGKKVFVK